MRKTYSHNQCHACQKPLDQPKTGRTRYFCDDACKQRRYRFVKRQEEGRAKRHRRKKKPSLYERHLPPDKTPVVLRQLTNWLTLYQCPLCGRNFSKESFKGGVRKVYCSDECTLAARVRMEVLEKATAAAIRNGKGNETVMQRMEQGFLSPMCAHCGAPFPYRMHGGGRRRKYCTDRCRKEAYETRYQRRYKRKRKPHFGTCPNCGERYDKHDTQGRLSKHFCSKTCNKAYSTRVRRTLKREREALGLPTVPQWLRHYRTSTGKQQVTAFRNVSEEQSSGAWIGAIIEV